MFGIISGIRNQVGLLFGPSCIGLSNKTYRIHTQALPTHPPARWESRWPLPARQHSEQYKYILLGLPCGRVISADTRSGWQHVTATWHPLDETIQSGVQGCHWRCSGTPWMSRRQLRCGLLPIDRLGFRTFRLVPHTHHRQYSRLQWAQVVVKFSNQHTYTPCINKARPKSSP